MMKKKMVAIGAMGLAALAFGAVPKPYVEQGIALKETVPCAYTNGAGKVFLYRWHAPKEVKPGELYPLVIAMHGWGANGADNKRQLTQLGDAVFSCMRQSGNIRGGYDVKARDFYYLAGQAPAGMKWVDVPWESKVHTPLPAPSQTMGLQLELLEKIFAKTPSIDRRRVYVVGLSMGGYGTWDLMARKPEWIAAAMPICGGGDPDCAPKMKDISVWAFHTATDDVVPVCRSREMVRAMWDCGAPHIRYTELDEFRESPNGTHWSWCRATGEHGDFHPLDWVLSRVKPTAEGRRVAQGAWPNASRSLFDAALSNAVCKPGSWKTEVNNNPGITFTALEDETLFTPDDYENFELDCCYRFDKGGRGGIVLYADGKSGKGVEICLADDEDPALDARPDLLTGSIKGFARPVRCNEARPCDYPWWNNRMIIRAEGPHLQVFLNGELIQDADLAKLGCPLTKGRIGFRGKTGKSIMFYRWISVRPIGKN